MVALTETEWGSLLLLVTDTVRAAFDFLAGFTLVTVGGVSYSLLDLLVSIAFLWLLVDFIHDCRGAGGGSSSDEYHAPQPGYELERFYGRRR